MSGQFTIIANDGPGNVWVYDGTPGPHSLVASHCPRGAAVDLFGTPAPANDWCAQGYELIAMTEIWPGTLIRKAVGQ